MKEVPGSLVSISTELSFASTFEPKLILTGQKASDSAELENSIAGCTVAAAGW